MGKGVELITIAICDDEKIIRERITDLISEQGADCHIDHFAAGNELLATGKQYDLIFLDIQMEGKNGIETARAIRGYDRQAVIVFVTALKEYVFAAFDVAAFHYLLKPIEAKKFAEVFHNAVKGIQEKQRTQEVEVPTLLIKTKNRSRMLKQNEIIFIENRANKVEIHTEGDVFEAYYSMSKLESELGSSFYRCHRGYLVNMEHITEYSNDMIDMDNGDRVYMAKDKYPKFVKEYMRYLGDGGMADE